jgi:predicted phosphodiesterase
LAACSGGSSGGRSSSGSTSGASTSGGGGSTSSRQVSALVVAGAPNVSGAVAVVHRLTDPNAGPADVAVTFSLNNGASWAPTTDGAGGAGRTNLTTGPSLGAEHIYMWDSPADVPTSATGVLVKVEIVGGGSLTSGPLNVDNQILSTALQLTRRPYVQNTTQTSVVIAWHTDLASDSTVEWGTGASLGTFVTGTPGTRFHDVEITGLQSGTTYTYRIMTQGQPLTLRQTFQTATPPTSTADVTFIAFGDSGSASAEQYTLGTQMATETVDFIIHTGDVIYPSGGFPNAEAEYNLRFFKPYEDFLDRTPIFPSPGNHDAGSLFAPFQTAFYLPDNGGPALTEELYYSFEWGDCKFIMLESTALFKLPIGAHMTWLLNELQNNQRRWLIVYFHHTLYSAMGGDSTLRAIYEPIFELLDVDLVVAGHDHNYERTLPIRDFNPDPTYPGLVHVITGGGGKGPLDYPTPNANSDVVISEFHYMKFRISGDWLYGDAIGLNGQVLDSFALRNN